MNTIDPTRVETEVAKGYMELERLALDNLKEALTTDGEAAAASMAIKTLNLVRANKQIYLGKLRLQWTMAVFTDQEGLKRLVEVSNPELAEIAENKKELKGKK